MIISVQIDTDRSISTQIDEIARLLIPTRPAYSAVMVPLGFSDDTVRAVMSTPTPKPAKKPRASKSLLSTADYADLCDEVLIALGNADGPLLFGQIAELVKGYGHDDIRRALKSIGAVTSGKARGTRYALPQVQAESDVGTAIKAAILDALDHETTGQQ